MQAQFTRGSRQSFLDSSTLIQTRLEDPISACQVPYLYKDNQITGLDPRTALEDTLIGGLGGI